MITKAEKDALAERIARGIFACGLLPNRPVTRIQFLSGKYPNNEKRGGGLCEVALVSLITRILEQNND